MPKYIELSAEETIKTEELFGRQPEQQSSEKEEPDNGSDKELR